jgi:integrase
MPKVRFNLKNKITDPALIIVKFRYEKGKVFVYSTGQHIPIKYWDDEKMRAKRTYLWPQYKELNILLDRLEHNLLNSYRKAINSGIRPSPDLFRNDLAPIANRQTEQKADFISFAERFAQERKSKFKPNTIKSYYTSIGRIKTYLEETGNSLYFKDVDLDFFYQFTDWLNKKGYKINTIAKTIRIIKTIMNDATERGVNTNLAYQNKRFSVTEEEVFNIYLNVDELSKIYHCELEDHLRRAADLFLVGAFTGLRVSDFTKLKESNITNIKGNKAFRVRATKGNDYLLIPIHPIVDVILERYNGKPPKPIENQTLNRYLKNIGYLAGINDKVRISYTQGGERVNEVLPKYEMITNHTARRSFATNAYLSDVPAYTIMKITGHSTEKSFLKYIKAGAQEHSMKIVESDFFRVQLKKV